MSTSTERLFQDWTRVQETSSSGQPWINGRNGVIVWNPAEHEYNVLWDDNGWESYTPSEAKKGLREL